MNDQERVPLIRLADVPNLAWLPPRPNGKRLGLATVYRWVHRGLRGHRLRTIPVGGVLATSEQWLMDFFQQLAAPDTPLPDSGPTVRQRRKAIAQAERVLEQAGI